VIIGDNGDPERMRGITQDITARLKSRSAE
jgi:hypothetical protein